MTDEKKTSKLKLNSNKMGVGIAIGVALGVALDNIGLGIALGVAFGVAFSSQQQDDGTEK